MENYWFISSSQPATDEDEHDVIHAEKYGTLARDEFINSRLRTNSNFIELVKRPKLKVHGSMNRKTTVKYSDKKVMQFRQRGNIAFHLLFKSRELRIRLDLEELAKYPLTLCLKAYQLQTASYVKQTNRKIFKR